MTEESTARDNALFWFRGNIALGLCDSRSECFRSVILTNELMHMATGTTELGWSSILCSTVEAPNKAWFLSFYRTDMPNDQISQWKSRIVHLVTT